MLEVHPLEIADRMTHTRYGRKAQGVLLTIMLGMAQAERQQAVEVLQWEKILSEETGATPNSHILDQECILFADIGESLSISMA